MSGVTESALALRELLAAHRPAVIAVLARHRATNPRLFGSVARGDASLGSDVDLLVDLVPGAGNELLRVAGIGEELGRILGVRVDVVTETLLRGPVSAQALQDAVRM